MNLLTYFQIFFWTPQHLMFRTVQNNGTSLAAFVTESIIWLPPLKFSLSYTVPELNNS